MPKVGCSIPTPSPLASSFPLITFASPLLLGLVVRKPINANPGLIARGFHFSCVKASPLPILHNNLKAAKIKLLNKHDLQESKLLNCSLK